MIKIFDNSYLEDYLNFYCLNNKFDWPLITIFLVLSILYIPDFIGFSLYTYATSVLIVVKSFLVLRTNFKKNIYVKEFNKHFNQERIDA